MATRSLHGTTSPLLLEAARMTRRQHIVTARSSHERRASAGRQSAQTNAPMQMSPAERSPNRAAAPSSGTHAVPTAEAMGGAADQRVDPIRASTRSEQNSVIKSPALVRTAQHTTSHQHTLSVSAASSTPDPRSTASLDIGTAARPRAAISRIMSSSSLAEGRPPTPKRRWRFAARLKPFGRGHWRPRTDSPRVANPVPRDSSEANTEDPTDAQVS